MEKEEGESGLAGPCRKGRWLGRHPRKHKRKNRGAACLSHLHKPKLGLVGRRGQEHVGSACHASQRCCRRGGGRAEGQGAGGGVTGREGRTRTSPHPLPNHEDTSNRLPKTAMNWVTRTCLLWSSSGSPFLHPAAHASCGGSTLSRTCGAGVRWITWPGVQLALGPCHRRLRLR